jgi:hypothetical protein
MHIASPTHAHSGCRECTTTRTLVARAHPRRVAQITTLEGSPLDVWKRAAELVERHTNLASAYVAVITQPEEPDYTWPEEEDEGGDKGTGGAGGAEGSAETDDEAEDHRPVGAKAAKGDGEEGDEQAEEPATGVTEVRRRL